MDGWMDGWMDGRTDGRTDGQTDGWHTAKRSGTPALLYPSIAKTPCPALLTLSPPRPQPPTPTPPKSTPTPQTNGDIATTTKIKTATTKTNANTSNQCQHRKPTPTPQTKTNQPPIPQQRGATPMTPSRSWPPPWGRRTPPCWWPGCPSQTGRSTWSTRGCRCVRSCVCVGGGGLGGGHFGVLVGLVVGVSEPPPPVAAAALSSSIPTIHLSHPTIQPPTPKPPHPTTSYNHPNNLNHPTPTTHATAPLRARQSQRRRVPQVQAVLKGGRPQEANLLHRCTEEGCDERLAGGAHERLHRAQGAWVCFFLLFGVFWGERGFSGGRCGSDCI